MSSGELCAAFARGLTEEELRHAITWACRYLDITAGKPQIHEYYERNNKTAPSTGSPLRHSEP